MGERLNGEPCAWKRASTVRGDGMGKRAWGNPATRPVSIQRWRKLAEAVNEFVGKGSSVFVEGELHGEPQDGSQNPRVWTGQDGEARASYEITARTVKFLGKREGNGGAPIGEPPPGGEDEDLLPF